MRLFKSQLITTVALIAATFAATQASALETTASGQSEHASQAGLGARLDASNALLTAAINDLTNRIKLCAGRTPQALYNPGGAGADADGCVAIAGGSTVNIPDCQGQNERIIAKDSKLFCYTERMVDFQNEILKPLRAAEGKSTCQVRDNTGSNGARYNLPLFGDWVCRAAGFPAGSFIEAPVSSNKFTDRQCNIDWAKLAAFDPMPFPSGDSNCDGCGAGTQMYRCGSIKK